MQLFAIIKVTLDSKVFKSVTFPAHPVVDTMPQVSLTQLADALGTDVLGTDVLDTDVLDTDVLGNDLSSRTATASAQRTIAEPTSASAPGPVLVCFPTDTVPALATAPVHAGLIYTAKGRTPDKPLILMGASLDDLLPYVKGDEAALRCWRSLTQQHWPGQLTLVLPASDRTPAALNPLGTGTLGIRVPNHPIALDLLARTGPLATTSANLSGQPPLTELADIACTFPTALTLPSAAFSQPKNQPGNQPGNQPKNQPEQAVASGTPSTVALWVGDSLGGSDGSKQNANSEQVTNSRQWKILRQGTIQL